MINAQDRRRITDVIANETDPAERKALQEALSQLDRTRVEGDTTTAITFHAADRLLRARKKPKRDSSKRPPTQKMSKVAAEALVRNLPAFSEFLNVAALSDTHLVSFATMARECGVSGPTIKSYFEILEDTLLAHPAVADCAVVGVPDEQWGEAVAAVIVVADGCTVEADELRGWVKERLRSSRTHERVEFRPGLPYGETGELLRRKVRGSLGEGTS